MLSNFGRKTMRKRNLAMRFADFHRVFFRELLFNFAEVISLVKQMLKSSFECALTM